MGTRSSEGSTNTSSPQVQMPRPRPTLTDENRDFWTCGADGELRILRCEACETWIHPPSPRCPACLGRALRPQGVSGRGRVFSFTVNHHAWQEGLEVPFAIVLVELAEDPGVRLVANLVDCAPEQVAIGMPVEVVFERDGEIHVPLFRPRREA